MTAVHEQNTLSDFNEPVKESLNISKEFSDEESDISELDEIKEDASNNEQCSENEDDTDCLGSNGSVWTKNDFLELITNDISNLSEADVLRETSDTSEENTLELDTITFTKKSEKNNEKGKHVCPHCFKSFQYTSILKKHLHKHQQKLYQDSEEYESKKGYELCSMTGDVESSDIPTELNSKESQHKCNVCSRCFKVPSKLLRHIETHIGVKSYVCHVCSKAFLERQNLLAHFQIHSNEKPHICNICQRAFRCKSNLKRHLRSHAREKVCSECGVVCCSEKKLSLHVLRHQQKLHKCTHCEREFKKKSNLKRHLQIHSNAKEYQCSNCDYQATRKYHLERHVKRNHAD